MAKALIIFIKNPVKGKVKTRLAETVGETVALEIYKSLLAHTQKIAASVSTDKFIFYSEFVNPADEWNEKVFNKQKQHGNDLGDRMHNAFEYIFANGYHEVVIIGTDCLALDTTIIESAFQCLGENDVVIGPATDGGYYLLGMNKLNPCLFKKITWSTATVLQETLTVCENEKLKVQMLTTLSDIDVADDLNIDQKKLFKIRQ